eukprot:COSAG02_NODE_49337_length_327_cov_1.087719_1_plen_37_part_01
MPTTTTTTTTTTTVTTDDVAGVTKEECLAVQAKWAQA